MERKRKKERIWNENFMVGKFKKELFRIAANRIGIDMMKQSLREEVTLQEEEES